MSKLSDLLLGVESIKVRQSRAIARAADQQRAALAAGEVSADDIGYTFAIAVLAAATDRPAAEIEEMEGSIVDLGPAVKQVMAMAGFALGEATPAASPSSADSSGSMPPSLPATDMRRRRSAR